MLKKERQERILTLLDKNDYLSIAAIATKLTVSKMTIRRDVAELAQNAQLIKLYGGVQRLEHVEQELATKDKIHAHISEKRSIGKLMNQLIDENDTIYIGAGTTLLYALQEIKKSKLFIVTNSLLAFHYLIQHTHYRVLLTGGEFSRTSEEFYGEIAEKAFTDLNIDIAFAATNGIYNDHVTTVNSKEGALQKVAFTHAKVKCVVADSSKFNKSDVYTFYSLSNLDYIITDSNLSDSAAAYYSTFAKIKI
ncbi:MAG: DeoR/GlpR family DNA-binding transcription regulator [Enterococcus sp.]